MEVKENKDLVTKLKKLSELQKQDEDIKKILNIGTNNSDKNSKTQRMRERCIQDKGILYVKLN